MTRIYQTERGWLYVATNGTSGACCGCLDPMTDPTAPSPIRFATEADAVTWIDANGLDCWAHDGGRGWIAVAMTPQGVCAATSPTTGVILHDW